MSPEQIDKHTELVLAALGPNPSYRAVFDAGYKLCLAHDNMQRPAVLGSLPVALPATFREQNQVLAAPRDEAGQAEEGVWDIPCAVHQHGVITCWKFSPAMTEELQRTRRLYVSILGHSIPPMSLTVASPFLEMEDSEPQ